jgi:RNA polymerase sigma-70 factor (ECF subfamily)
MSDKSLNSLLSWSQLREEDDSILMAQLVAGNGDAFAVIVDRYRRLVLSVAFRIVRNAAEAEDIVQNVFLDIFRVAGQFDPSRGSLKVWILQYAYTRSINRRHYLEQRQFYSAMEIEEVNPLNLPMEPVNTKRLLPLEIIQIVRQSLRMLSERQQSVIELMYFEGLTLAEASRRTGESQSALRHNYYRGLMKLREVIGASWSSGLAQSEESSGHIPLEVANLKTRAI